LVQVAIKPQSKFATKNKVSQRKLITGRVSQNLLSSTNSKTLRIALDEVKIFSAPMKNFEAWIEFVEKRLASTVEMIGYVK
jgi:hypothetical protein